MELTEEWLKEKGACADGVDWFKSQKMREAIPVLCALIAENKLDWANWTIIRVMSRPQCLAYAIYAAENVIEIFEKKYPNDERPRKAIEAAKKVLANDTKETRSPAYAAAYAAYAVADAAEAYAADAAAYAAAYAADAAYAAAYAATYAYAADAAADAAEKREIKLRILNYGLSLLEE